MRKRIILLAAAMLFHACARAEPAEFYTNQPAPYYHADPDCDRPPSIDPWTNQPGEFYEREIYRKYPISQAAAEEFEKKPCPLCVKRFQPTYLGEHMPEWTDAAFTPWGTGKPRPEFETSQELANYPGWGGEAYRAEVADTGRRFEDYFEQTYDAETGEYSPKHPYPDFFAGRWANNADGMTCAIVDPTEEILAKFQEMFGGGAWIVAAKCGENELRAAQEKLFDEVRAWCAAHPELDAQPASASVDVVNNLLTIGLSGADWREAAAGIDAELAPPAWVCFREREPAHAASAAE